MTTDVKGREQGRVTSPVRDRTGTTPPTQLERLWATNRRLGWLIVGVLVVAAAIVAGALLAGDDAGVSPAEEAATARLEAEADAYGTWLDGRVDRAAADRLTAQYEVRRQARANAAATARLDAAADRYAQRDAAHQDRIDQAATDRLTGLAEQAVGR